MSIYLGQKVKHHDIYNGKEIFEVVGIKCEGNCVQTHGEHSGKVKPVIVYSSEWKETKFNYCQNAVDEDRRRGFTVEER